MSLGLGAGVPEHWTKITGPVGSNWCHLGDTLPVMNTICLGYI